MLRSLTRHDHVCRIFVLCMDEVTLQVLNRLNIAQVTLIALNDFETSSLLEIKKSRSVAEYCWTCTPHLAQHVLSQFPEVGHVVYIDADLMFFSSPSLIFKEIETDSVSIIEHRFSKGFESAIVNGKYNVQWVGFKRDPDGIAVLNWWADRCREWCFNRLEDGKFGDQKYLDNWVEIFGSVYEIRNIGAGVGPWNYASYDIQRRNDQVLIDNTPLIFYHFHGYKMLDDGGCTPMPFVYMKNHDVPAEIYEPYRHALWSALMEIREILPSFSTGILSCINTDQGKEYLSELLPQKSFFSRLKNKLFLD